MSKPKKTLMQKQLRRWRFVWNNYEAKDVTHLENFTVKDCKYITFGFEICPTTGTPHLQGYIEFDYPVNGAGVKNKLDPTRGKGSPIHLDQCDATRDENVAYVQKTETKDSSKPAPFVELDFRVTSQGIRTDWIEARDFLLEKPDFEEFFMRFPDKAMRYASSIKTCIRSIIKKQAKQELKDEYPLDAKLYEWQRKLVNRLHGKPDNRKIIWFYDEKGNHGKSWISDYLEAHMKAVVFPNASTKDLAYAYNGEPIVIIDYSRSNEERINYSVLENFKDGRIFSSKYESELKRFKKPWLIVMSNFMPKLDACSRDRWEVHTLSGEPTFEDDLTKDWVLPSTSDVVVEQIAVPDNIGSFTNNEQFQDTMISHETSTSESASFTSSYDDSGAARNTRSVPDLSAPHTTSFETFVQKKTLQEQADSYWSGRLWNNLANFG